ncbi:MAG: holo-ACP synthase [Actinobacteria bacterium HGW-Actinobacteria-2]|nr:MAG: holo-ACP synthase [Actinobacteria bacterium HGW-Actinobacteria-2]
MIVGIGMDITEVFRFSRAIERPGVKERLFTAAEADAPIERLAGRFAAKEALAKAVGAPLGLVWTDVEVLAEDTGQPYFVPAGTVAARLAELGVTSVFLSISHDAGVAAAMVVCEA